MTSSRGHPLSAVALALGLALAAFPGGAQPAPSSAVTLSWSQALVRRAPAWYAAPQARALAATVLVYQSPEGGWPKNHDLSHPPSSAAALAELQRSAGNTLDNGATTLPIRFLARVATASGDEPCRTGVVRGVDYLLAAQYANGGFPQFFPLRDRGYTPRITYNDNAMVSALVVLRDVAAGAAPFAFIDPVRRAKAADAVGRGIDCILKTQVSQGGKRTVWCAQHDETTLAPAWGRAYEPPSLSGSESVGIVRFLMGIEEPTPEVVAAIEGAVAWLNAVAIHGIRVERFFDASGKRDIRVIPDSEAGPLWARFYELGTDRPLFMGRDSKPVYFLAEIEQERRGGYAYHGTSAASLLATDYPRWRAKHKRPS